MAENKAVIVLSAKDETAIAFAKAKAGLAQLRAAGQQLAPVFGALGLAVTGAAAALDLKEAIDAADELSKLGQKTGIAVEQLSALKFAGELSNVSVDDLATGLKKLGNNMADAAGGGKAALATFAAIGVSVKTAAGNLRSTDEVLGDIADKFAGYEDGAAKAALATDIFGKNGAALIPFLNNGRKGLAEMKDEAEKLGVVIGDKLGKQSEQFNDNLTRLAAAAQGAKLALLGDLLPALVKITEEFIDARKAYGSFWEGFKDVLSGSTAEGGLEKTRAEIDKLKTSIVNLQKANSENKGLFKISGDKPLNALKEELALLEKRKKFQESSQARAALASGEGVADERLFRTGTSIKKAAPVVDKTTRKDESLAEFNALIDKIHERTAADEQQIAIGRQLTEQEKFEIAVLAQLTGQKTKLTDAEKASVKVELEKQKAAALVLETRKLLRDAADADAKAEQDALKLIEDQTDALVQENSALFDQLALFGAGTIAIEQYRLKRLENTLAIEQSAIAIKKARGENDGELIDMQNRATALQRQISLRKELVGQAIKFEDDPFEGATRALQNYAAEVAQAGITTERFVTDSLHTLEDGLTDALTGKVVDARQIVDSIIAEFVRLQVVKPLLNEIFGGGSSGGFAGVIASLFGGFKASGGAVTAGTPYVVGERGREMFVPQVNGSIVPNSALGGGAQPIVNNNISVGAGMPRGEVMSLLQVYGQQIKGEILNSMRNGGSFSR